MVNNELDLALDMRNAVIKSILEQNPKITTHTGNEPPHGYLDWWPNSLWVNTQIEPFNDPNVRKAISLSINRDQIDEIVYEGAKIAIDLPLPALSEPAGLCRLAGSEGAGREVSAAQV